MLEWSADDHAAGDTLRLDAPREIRVRAHASSQFAMRNLELIVNGRVILTNIPVNSERELVLNQEVKIDGAGWLAVRCTSANSTFPGGQTLTAHGNPIYIEMAGHPFDSRADAEYFLAWIDRLEADVRKRDRVPAGLDHVKLQIDAARAVYRRLAGAPRR